MTGKSFVVKTLVRYIAVVAALGSIVFVEKANAPEDYWNDDSQGYVTSLIEENDCWTGTKPEGAETHRVVMQKAGAPYVAGQKMVDFTLSRILNGKELPYGWMVFAYCDKVKP